ncbi:MAG TPA: AF1514 family protein [Thiobacillaceae bacterium]|nr:AF1514 family protein [Thiobacillaceae bacterium]HNU64829.1 AF1514 family protein [Thiobacillaceae bacterium]
MSEPEADAAFCPPRRAADYSQVRSIELDPAPMPADYRAAMKLAEKLAKEALGEHMLISWYDRDRDFESPQHSSECHQDSAVPGYVDYGLNHGARLKVDIGAGRFVFFFMPLEGL